VNSKAATALERFFMAIPPEIGITHQPPPALTL